MRHILGVQSRHPSSGQAWRGGRSLVAMAVISLFSASAYSADVSVGGEIGPGGPGSSTYTVDSGGITYINNVADNAGLNLIDTITDTGVQIEGGSAKALFFGADDGFGNRSAVEIDGTTGQLQLTAPGAAASSTTIGPSSSTFGGALTVQQGGIAVTGNSSVAGSLGVTGATTLTGALGVTGNTTLTGTLGVTGNTTLTSGTNSMSVTNAAVSAQFNVGGVQSALTLGAVSSGTGAGLDVTGVGSVVQVTNSQSGTAHGLFVRSSETVLSGGTASTEMTLNDNGLFVSDSVNNNTFTVSNTGVATVGNGSLAGSLIVEADNVGNTANGSLIIRNTAGSDYVSLTGVANTISGNTNTITGATSTALVSGGNSLTVSAAAGTAVIGNASIGGNLGVVGNATIGGNLDMTNGTISNLAPGVAGTDAVNVNQLNSAVGVLGNRIDKLEKRTFAGLASVAALAAVPSPASGKRFTVGAGVGSYGNQHAMAMGFRGVVTDSVSVTVGLGIDSQSKKTANAGIGFSW